MMNSCNSLLSRPRSYTDARHHMLNVSQLCQCASAQTMPSLSMLCPYSFLQCLATGEHDAEERPLTKRQRKRAKQLQEERIRTAEQRQLSQPAPESALEFERLVCFLTLSLHGSPVFRPQSLNLGRVGTPVEQPLSALTLHTLSKVIAPNHSRHQAAECAM